MALPTLACACRAVRPSDAIRRRPVLRLPGRDAGCRAGARGQLRAVGIVLIETTRSADVAGRSEGPGIHALLQCSGLKCLSRWLHGTTDPGRCWYNGHVADVADGSLTQLRHGRLKTSQRKRFVRSLAKQCPSVHARPGRRVAWQSIRRREFVFTGRRSNCVAARGTGAAARPNATHRRVHVFGRR